LGVVVSGIGVIGAIFKIWGNSPFAIFLLQNSDNQRDKLFAEICKNFSEMCCGGFGFSQHKHQIPMGDRISC